MTAHTTNGAGTVDDPAITVHLDDARDILWALDFITEWLDHASADTHHELNDFCQSCGRHQSPENLVTTIARQATNLRRALAAITPKGAAIGWTTAGTTRGITRTTPRWITATPTLSKRSSRSRGASTSFSATKPTTPSRPCPPSVPRLDPRQGRSRDPRRPGRRGGGATAFLLGRRQVGGDAR